MQQVDVKISDKQNFFFGPPKEDTIFQKEQLTDVMDRRLQAKKPKTDFVCQKYHQETKILKKFKALVFFIC